MMHAAAARDFRADGCQFLMSTAKMRVLAVHADFGKVNEERKSISGMTGGRGGISLAVRYESL